MPRFTIDGQAQDGPRTMTVDAPDAQAARAHVEQHGVSVQRVRPEGEDVPDAVVLRMLPEHATDGGGVGLIFDAASIVGGLIVVLGILIGVFEFRETDTPFLPAFTAVLSVVGFGLGLMVVAQIGRDVRRKSER